MAQIEFDSGTVSPAGQMPWLYGALLLLIPTSGEERMEPLQGFKQTVHKNADGSSETAVLYREVKELRAWEVDDLLNALFSDCDFEELSRLQTRLKGRVLVHISFHHYDIYPAQFFGEKNMEIIHRLHADISIDPH